MYVGVFSSYPIGCVCTYVCLCLCMYVCLCVCAFLRNHCDLIVASNCFNSFCLFFLSNSNLLKQILVSMECRFTIFRLIVFLSFRKVVWETKWFQCITLHNHNAKVMSVLLLLSTLFFPMHCTSLT